jgi:hypothetical protein
MRYITVTVRCFLSTCDGSIDIAISVYTGRNEWIRHLSALHSLLYTQAFLWIIGRIQPVVRSFCIGRHGPWILVWYGSGGK